MNDRLIIRLLADQQAVEWGLLNTQEATPKFLEQGNLLLDDMIALAEMAQHNHVTVLIPTSLVRSFDVDAPTKNRKHLEKAIPYLLEEQIIENVESQHFAIGQVSSSGKVSVNVISKNVVEQLLSKFEAAAIEPDVMIADAVCLPVFDDSWTLLEGEPVLVRQDANTFWSGDSSMVVDLLQWNLNEKIENEQTISQALRVFSENNGALNLESLSGFAIQPMPVDDELLWLSSQNMDSSINLLQQDFVPVKKSSSGMGEWKLPAIAASVALLVGLVYFGSNIITLNQEKDHYKARALEEVRKLSPSIDEDRLSSKITEIARMYEKAGSTTGQSQSFVGLLNKVYSQINPREVKLEQMEYVSKQGALNLDVSAANYQVLTASQEKLEKSGLKVEMKNANDNGDNWTTRLVVKVN